MAMIYHQVLINAVRSKIYEAITSQEGLSHWLTPDCVVKPDVGFINEFRIDPQRHYRMKIVHLQSGFAVEWKCLNQHDDWSATQISFHLADRGGQTCLDFKQTGFMSESEAYAASNFQWAKNLLALKVYCEAGGSQSHDTRVIAPVMALRSAVR